MQKFLTKECCCPAEAVDVTVSTIVADYKDIGFTLYDQRTITKSDGDGAYTQIFFRFFREDNEVF